MQREDVGCYCKVGFCKASTSRIVKEQTVFLGGPNRMRLKKTRPARPEKHAALPARTVYRRFNQRRLIRIYLIATAKYPLHVIAQLVPRWQRKRKTHAGLSQWPGLPCPRGR
jgi:hypothetical protein